MWFYVTVVMEKRVLLKDIAQKVGVSTALVSYVLNNQKENRISKEIAQKIRDTATRLNYRPNQIAKSLKTNKTFTIGLIVADIANAFLNHGNYLAYGLAASVLWVLGIPHGFALMHGKTRRGALVFDIADLIKDSLILPWAFICAREGMNENKFRQHCLQKFTDVETT